MTRPAVPDTVPAQLDQHGEKETHLQDDQPQHVAVPGSAHLLVIQVQKRAIALSAFHVLGVLDQITVFIQKFLDNFNIVAIAGPWIVCEVINIFFSPHKRMF